MQIKGNKVYYGDNQEKKERLISTKKTNGKKIRLPIKIFFSSLIVFFMIIVSCLLVLRSVAPVIVSHCEARIRSLTTIAINGAIFESMSNGVDYSDIISVEKDNNGKIILLQANAMLVNSLARDTAKIAEVKLNSIGEQGILIPIGTLTNTPLLAGLGPNIEITVLPMASVVCNFISEFEPAGINQTRHKIFMEIRTNVNVIIPTANTNVVLVNQLLVCESIIVGEVPEVYLQMTNLGGNGIDLKK